MLKLPIKYTNFEGEEKECILHFHVGKAELMRMGVDESFLQRMHNAAMTRNKKAVLAEVENLVRLAYGVRPEGSDGFRKSEELTQEFLESPAYDEFLMYFLGDEHRFMEVVQAIFPAEITTGMVEKLKTSTVEELVAENEKHLNPLANTDVVNKSAAALSETAVEDKRPAWEQQNRRPTKAELREMDKSEMVRAFRKHPSLMDEADVTDA